MLSSIFNWSVVAILASFTMMPVSINRQTAPTVEPIVEEAELKGCATNFESQGLIPFYYDGPIPASQTNVKDLNNWKPGNPLPSCNSGSDIACMILAHPNFVDDEDDPTSLLEGINIQTDEEAGNAYITSVSSGSTFQNRDI